MTRATEDRMRILAERLIALEAADKPDAGAGSVCATFRPHLAELMGRAGYVALLSRALSLASAEIGWLRGVRVKEDGELEGLNDAAVQAGPEQNREGNLYLVMQLLVLLRTFIGESLTLRLVGEAWPALSLDEINLSNGASP